MCETIRSPLGSSAVWSARFSLSLSIYLSNHKRRPGGVLLLRVSLSTGAAEAWHRVVFSEKRFKKQGICPNVNGGAHVGVRLGIFTRVIIMAAARRVQVREQLGGARHGEELVGLQPRAQQASLVPAVLLVPRHTLKNGVFQHHPSFAKIGQMFAP